MLVELSCVDEDDLCKLFNGFVVDLLLDQVCIDIFELGVNIMLENGLIYVVVYCSESKDDIIF